MVSEIEQLEKAIEEAESLAEQHRTWGDILKKQLEVAKEKVAWQARYPRSTLGQESATEVKATRPRRRSGNQKPRNQLIEEIILEHGRPMHVSDIVERLQALGVTFGGTTPPKTQVTSSVSKSKRFVNTGGNKFLVDSMPLPDHQVSVASQHGEGNPPVEMGGPDLQRGAPDLPNHNNEGWPEIQPE